MKFVVVCPPGSERILIKGNTPGLHRSAGLLGGLVLGDGLGALGDGVLGELTGEDETDGGLDLAGGHGLALVVLAQAAGLAGDSPEGVADEGVEDGHRALADAGVRVDLLQNAVDVDVVGLTSFSPVPASSWSSSSSGHVVSVSCSCS